MGTANSGDITEDELGVIPRVIRDIFDRMNKQSNIEYMVRVSYMEIYNENIKDLLNPNSSNKSLTVREDDTKGMVVVGIKEEVVTCYQDMIRCLETGAVYRTVGSTLMNETSSRSHSLFTIIVEQKEQGEYMMAKFHLVDLAGSERTKRTGAVGIRFKEAVQINCGLLALGNVISALGDDKKRKEMSHVPYRDSKLTRLLQDSLGGNSRTVMIACVSPADSNFEETLNTLKYANRARNIKNTPIVNRDPHSAQLAELKNQIQSLQLELLKHKVARDENGEPIGKYTLDELLKDEQNHTYLLELQNKTVHTNEFKPLLEKIKALEPYLSSDELKQQLRDTIDRMENIHYTMHNDEDEKQISMLQATIKEQKEDLARDEKIFSEKQKELRKMSKSNWVLKKTNLNLRKKLEFENRCYNMLEKFIQENVDKGQLPSDALTNLKHVMNGDVVATNAPASPPKDEKGQSIHDIEADIRNLETEAKRVLGEKNEIEQEKLKMEHSIQEQQRSFQKEQKKLEKNLSDLTIMIRLKEELIRDLVKSERESQVIKEQYELRIHQMETEVKTAQLELEKVHSIEKSEKEKKKMEEEYQLEIKKKNAQLAELKKKQLDSQKLIKLKYQSDRRVKDLESEIDKMKSQADYLKKKITQEVDKYKESSLQREKHIQVLRRDSEQSLKRIRDLEIENQRQKSILRRKTEQLSRSYKKQDTEIDKQKQWLDKEIEKYLKKKEAMELLDKELSRREQIIREKENMTIAKQELEKTRRMPSQISGLEKQIESIQKQINDEGETLELTNKLETVIQQKTAILNQQIEEEQTLRELDERTEVLQAEIEYKNEAIAQAQRELGHDDEEDDQVLIDDQETDVEHGVNTLNQSMVALDSRLKHALINVQDVGEAKSMLQKYFDKIIELKQTEKKKETKLLEMDMFLKERNKIIENLQKNIKLTEAVYERRLTKQQKEHEMKLKAVQNGTEQVPATTTSSDDQHTLDYYKQSSNDLKRRLREIAQQNERQHQELDSVLQKNQTLTELNDRLTNELRSLKNYLVTYGRSSSSSQKRKNDPNTSQQD
jgi:hypothetical protein